ncbi:amino acid ABC transporter substrate-binding protein [[Haemophilus] ducreyi]|uniref:amino acid ABC transporter substrate-binding protein n=1 Tax=Haemophilus ducreyi TaxID=730 RepID=UPI0006563CA2|nr:amino acid ABC transporter substrate-binding protein [[Haemophilus] ducreyi]AKO37363.1 amino acid ABC transporter substrate-binding protein [[Haemophilus] ducreyi]AKO38827.1 amino acid ABC transporter substrate-binding protein [[Haemophilus] ducreyi]AKO41852.1 amino acid ABC transporter substrate-binding protein [[Haemophilus] ducreyi]AKO43280.1 amino acid ABC transporter substrate-binding protein [[Haemophilus] ducreyi]
MLKKIAFATLTAISLFTSMNSLASNDLLSRIDAKGTISVATEGTYPPFTYHDQTGKLTGYDVEVTRAITEKLGVKVDFKETQWDAMLAGLKAGRFDLVANQVALSTPERQAMFDLSDAYSWSGAALVVRADNRHVKQPADVQGIKVAQSLSSNYGELAVKNGAKVISVDGMAQALLLIQQQRVEATFNNYLALLDYFNKNPTSSLKIIWQDSEQLGAGLVVNKGNQAALAKINQAIMALHQDGTFKRLGEQFFGKDISVK